MMFHVSPLESILSETRMALWHTTRIELMSDSAALRHRASYDAWLVQQTFQRTLRESTLQVLAGSGPGVTGAGVAALPDTLTTSRELGLEGRKQ